VTVERTRWRGEPALVLRAGPTAATVLPDLGMTGVALRHDGRGYLAAPGGPGALRGGHTLGLPLLAPWANRLGSRRYRVGRVAIDLRRRPCHTDANGLPIHGLLVGAAGWRVVAARGGHDSATLTATRDLDDPAFPFPHRIEVRWSLRPGRLAVRTTVVPTGRRRVPVAFGWHPYLRVPGAPRSRWRLGLPPRTHLALDRRGVPTGVQAPVPGEAAPIGRRTFDDLYALGARRVLTLTTDAHAVEVRVDRGYPFAQVWVPPGRDFVALEPMTVATNALVDGGVPMVAPGDTFSAAFALVLR
jgi:galactose mutarotase-like enzyme